MSEDRALELIVNGLAEDVIALLARVPGFFVIARASSFQYARQTPDTRQSRHRARRPLCRHRQRAQLGRSQVRITVAARRGRERQPALGRPLRRRPRQHARSAGRDCAADHGRAGARADQGGLFAGRPRRRTDSVDAWSHVPPGRRRHRGSGLERGDRSPRSLAAVAAARSRSTPNSRWRGRCSLMHERLWRQPVAGARYRAAAERVRPRGGRARRRHRSERLGRAGLRRLRAGRYRRAPNAARDIAPRARARSEQRAGPHRIRRDRAQTVGRVRRGHQEHASSACARAPGISA